MENSDIVTFCRKYRIKPDALATLIDILGPQMALEVIKSGKHTNIKSTSMQTAYKASQPTFTSGVDYVMSKAFKGWKHG